MGAGQRYSARSTWRWGPRRTVVSVANSDRRTLRPVDVVVAATVAVPTVADAWWSQPGTRAADGLTYLLVGVAVGALLVRHRWPVYVAAVCGIAWTALVLLGHRGEVLNLPSVVALYTAAVQGGRRRSLVVGAAAVMWFGGWTWLVIDRSSAPVTAMLWPAAAILLGEVIRGRRELLAEYAEREARAAADRERDAQQRVQQERLRIAREFHDVVAHTMAAVNVQMGVAVAAFDQRPETARAALAQARSSSREALQELRATVSLLREAAPDESRAPAPCLDQIDDLAERARGAGLSVSLHCAVDGRQLPAAVEMAAYRTVQEALTNVIRHAHANAAAVSVTRQDDAVFVEITDDGTGAAPGDTGPPTAAVSGPTSNGGHGLTGMTERVAAMGGRVEWGPMSGGGFRVRAVLPVSEDRP
jgi:signal transduction histidine kinase